MRARRYGDFNNAKHPGGATIGKNHDINSHGDFKSDSNEINDDWLIEEYSIKDWLESSQYPNRDRLLDLLRPGGERHSETDDSKKVIKPTSSSGLRYIHGTWIAFLGT